MIRLNNKQRGELNRARDAKIIHLRNQGVVWRVIAEEVGLSIHRCVMIYEKDMRINHPERWIKYVTRNYPPPEDPK